MTSSNDSWTRAALSDDVIVVELLLRLKESRAATSTSLLQSRFTAKSLLPRWGMRLPRSKAAAAAFKDESTRISPTTPLSWSDGGVGSQSTNTADGFEESSHLRSKGSAAYESTSTTTNGIKWPRKKKVYDELKDLLDERTSLRKEIATLQTTFKEQRAQNDNFKRAKLDLNLQSSATSLFAYSDGAENANAIQARLPPSFTHFPSHLLSHVSPYIHPYPQLDSCDEHKPLSSSGNNSFVLPDLNMVPSEDDSGNSETLYGMS